MDKNKMLIDATHPEETRVVALRSGRVEEFDFESAARKLLRGNIYLAKVTRVEPSLQAAFIDYGGNRHGFLAFNEIHPDYYQIPVADREALKQAEAEAEQRDEAEADERAQSRGSRRRRKGRGDRNGGEGQGQRREARDPSQDIETFEDGYQTSGPAPSDLDEGNEAAPLEHSHQTDDVLRAEPDVLSPTPHSEPLGFDLNADPQRDPSDWGVEPQPVSAARYEGTGPGDVIVPGGDEIAPDHHHDGDEHGSDDHEDRGDAESSSVSEDDQVEQIASEEDALEELPERPRRRARQYKIQEVIKRRQIMLVQVVKEERGNKGAALTTYISLAGRYTVLMPNTARGGGISRKITQPQDRKRLKAIAEELEVEEGMGLIIRTAGAARTKQEIKRDYDYLLRLWESVRELTLSSTAPCLVYEEGNIIKRAIRDLYSKDFDQIVVAGDAAHREAQDFMEMLMPGAGSQVASYRAPEPLFAKYGIERQLNALFSPYVTLRSGGYIVINQTEALVSVDVNSGKSTREFSIEETALNTNLEASDEIARQLKLRDLAGLIVIDFIDMEEKRNNRNVERRLKDALRHDRARIQVGHISHFGLMEMSRQRLRAGVLEGSTSQCPHCQGTGIIRSIESVALAVLRGIEDHLLKQPSSLAATTTAEVALYILNHKRAFIAETERRHGVSIRVEASDRMQGANFGIERIAAPVALARPPSRTAVNMESGFDRDEDVVEDVDEPMALEAAPADRDGGDEETRGASEGGTEDERRGRRRRRRRGRKDGSGGSRDAHAHAPLHATGHGEPGEGDPGEGDEPAHGEARIAVRPYREGAEASAGAGDEMVDAEAGQLAGAADDDGETEQDGEIRAEGDGGDARRRGRRRGRRGGRSRRRDGEALPVGEEAQNFDGDRHEWGIAEVARPGAEQPGTSSSAGFAHGHDGALSSGIVETLGAEQRDRGYSASDAALQAAVTLAGGGQPDAPRAARPRTSPPMVEMAPVEVSPSEPPPFEVVTAPTVAIAPVPAQPRVVQSVPATPAPAARALAETEAVSLVETAPVEANWRLDSEAEADVQAKAEPVQTSLPEAAHFANGAPLTEPVAAGGPPEREVEPTAPLNGSAEAPAAEAYRDDVAPSRPTEMAEAERDEVPRPSRRGWWQRRFGGEE